MTLPQYRILRPHEYGDSIHSDWGFEINGERSERAYVSRIGAYNAMWRRIEQLSPEQTNESN